MIPHKAANQRSCSPVKPSLHSGFIQGNASLTAYPALESRSEHCVLPAQINDRYEFNDVLDLDVGDGKYLADSADRSVRNLCAPAQSSHQICLAVATAAGCLSGACCASSQHRLGFWAMCTNSLQT